MIGKTSSAKKGEHPIVKEANKFLPVLLTKRNSRG
jgi:hypothetical protein